MKDEDVKIGMKVVPHSKTAGEIPFVGCQDWGGKRYVCVHNQGSHNEWDLISHDGELYIGMFNASDFEPYVKPPRRELLAEIARLQAEVERLTFDLEAAREKGYDKTAVPAWQLSVADDGVVHVAKSAPAPELKVGDEVWVRGKIGLVAPDANQPRYRVDIESTNVTNRPWVMDSNIRKAVD